MQKKINGKENKRREGEMKKKITRTIQLVIWLLRSQKLLCEGIQIVTSDTPAGKEGWEITIKY